MKYISKKEIHNKKLNKLKSNINNKIFINKEIKNNIFNNINGYNLDIYQRKAVITDEDNILLIAGAGSGKTLTIIGKIKYLIEVLNIKEEEILCISFTNDTVNSLKKSLNYNIDVYTFHKLSLEILKNNNKNVSICDTDLLDYIIDEFFYCNIINKKLLKSDDYKLLKSLIITFINLFKSSNYKIDKLNNIINNHKYNEEYILLKIIKHIYIIYEEELKSTLKVDFNDMINNAIDVVKIGKIKPYKYIIIDEYQDTSYIRYKLIYEIKKRTNSKLFVVGDDYQSIYRFTGCDINMFLNFNKYFKYSKTMKLVNTYRNSNELINIASNFIMKNKYQIKKRLRSNKYLNKPIEIIYTNNKKKELFKLIDSIKTPILILGRNNNDIYKYFKNIDKDGYINYKDKIIRYLTVHKSKGLEEESVIIINLEDDILGFPCKIKNNNIINYILDNKDLYPYEEERRLFYVALTRTKNKVYLIVDRQNQSIFVKEIIKYNKNNIKINKIFGIM